MMPVASASPSKDAVSHAVPAMRTELFGTDRLDDWLAIWASLDAESPTPHATASHAWNATWIAEYGSAVEVRIAVRFAGEQPIGFWLVPLSRHRTARFIRLRTAHVGTAGEPAIDSLFVEYNRPFLASGFRSPEQETAFLADIIQAVRSLPIDRLDLDGIPHGMIPAERTPKEIEQRESPWIDFAPARTPSTDEPHGELLAMLRRKTRSNFRRAAKSYGTLSVRWETGPTATPAFDELVDLHQARWTAIGKPGTFGGSRVAPFYRKLVADGRLAMASTRDETGTIGSALIGYEAERAVCLVVGFADTSRRDSPGLVSLVPILDRALREGYAGFEFLVGDNLYKRMLTTDANSLVWATIPQATPRSRLVGGLRLMKRAIAAVRPRRVTKTDHA